MDEILNPIQIKKLVQFWLEEDCPNFDYGASVAGCRIETALLLCKSDEANVILAGRKFFQSIFEYVENCEIEWKFKDGENVTKGDVVAKIIGPANRLLLAERVALNCLSRCSGIATKAERIVEKVKKINGENNCVMVCGSRKTTPGFRLVEKYALLVGGCYAHRFDLSQMLMIKDNHIIANDANICRTLTIGRRSIGLSGKIEVECRSFEQALEACKYGADIVMLDNFSATTALKTAEKIKSNYPNILIDISGGITESNIHEYVSQHIDMISLGSLTYDYKSIDFSMKIHKTGYDPLNPIVY